MEVLLYHSAPCHVRLQLLEKGPSSNGLKHTVERRHRVLCSTSSCGCRSFGVPTRNHSLVKISYQKETFGSFNTTGNSQPAPVRVLNESYSDYVIGGDEGLEDTLASAESIQKIKIPGLPDESNGESSATISSCFWEWRPKLHVHYEKAGCENVNSPPLLFLPGFGVGSFHYEKQLKDLGRDFRVWAVDFLGQGKSLPIEDPAPLSREIDLSEQKDYTWGFGDQPEPWAKELVYSVDLWSDQMRYFIEEVIGEPVYVVGNSLGGYVAIDLASSNPGLVKGVTLLNATPFWGFLPNPIKSPLLARMFPWTGTFPLPANVRKVMEIIWQKVSDPETIAVVLRQVYADHSTNVDKVFSQIIETTQHPAAAASFASIMCAPTGKLSFKESLTRCRESNVPICLMYGKEDPWVTPIWGQQVKQQLPEAPYYEISPAGHCPHDEVPELPMDVNTAQVFHATKASFSCRPPLELTRHEPLTSLLFDFERMTNPFPQYVGTTGVELFMWNGFKELKRLLEFMNVVNHLLRGWIKNLESQGSVTLPLLDDAEVVQHDLAKELEFNRAGLRKAVTVRFFGSQFSFWNQIWSQFKAILLPNSSKLFRT